MKVPWFFSASLSLSSVMILCMGNMLSVLIILQVLLGVQFLL